jgi:hypothetical protein
MESRDPDYQVDPTTTTGAYHVVRGKYGRRRGDKPLWWVLAYHAAKACGGALPILAYLAIALLFRKCGIALPGTAASPGGNAP